MAASPFSVAQSQRLPVAVLECCGLACAQPSRRKAGYYLGYAKLADPPYLSSVIEIAVPRFKTNGLLTTLFAKSPGEVRA
jgi:hypothetical protein